MIDIHSHILPGIDDGSESMRDSLLMAEQAVSSGVTTLVATPHSNQPGRFENYNSRAQLDLFYRLKEQLQQEGIPLKLVRGMEIFSTDDVVQKIASGLVIPLNDSRYYLIEFAFDEEEWFLEETISGVLALGKVPVVAHPERYACVQDSPGLLYGWRKMGALAQMNKGSVLGRFGSRPRRCAETLLQHGLVNCIASDAHRPYARTTDMTEIAEYMARNFSEEYSALLLEDNPRRILADQTLGLEPKPFPVEERRRF